MTPDPKIRFARPPEAGLLVDIIREAFPSQVIRRTVYGCTGMVRYVRALTAGSPHVSPRFFVAISGATPVAAAEIAVADSDLFLSYIGTRQGLRSRGLGTQLLAAMVQYGLDQGLETMTLDVLAANTRAHKWYNRFGFSSVEERGWWETPSFETEHSLGSVAGWPQAEVCHRTFGFSEINVGTRRGFSRVGRLGVGWFRVPSLATLSDEQVIGTLHAIDPGRRILVMGPLGSSDSPGKPILRLIRLQAKLSDLSRLTGGR